MFLKCEPFPEEYTSENIVSRKEQNYTQKNPMMDNTDLEKAAETTITDVIHSEMVELFLLIQFSSLSHH